MNLKLEFKIVGLVVIVLLIAALLIGFFSVHFIRQDIEKIADIHSNSNVEFIKHAFEEAMVTGNADVAKGLMYKAEGVESVTVLDTEGKQAFSEEGKGNPEDIEIVNKIKESKSPFRYEVKDSIVYYMPLVSNSRCIKCHENPGSVLGIVKVVASVEQTNLIVNYRTKVVLISLVFGIVLFGAILWMVFKKTVITPIKQLKNATTAMSHGDLSFRTGIRSNDEMGALSDDMKETIRGIGNILNRQGVVSKRVANVSIEVEKESSRVLEGTQLESEAISNILNSIEELNKSIGMIAESIGGVSVSAEQTASSIDEMAANTEQIAKNTIGLSGAIDATSSSIEEMSASIKEVAQRTEELALSAEETLSATEEINSSIKDIETNARESARLSEKVTSEASNLGMAAMDKASESMERIQQIVEKTAGFIEKLGGRSEEIGKILNIISEITDQTTLLALNAAILAAQAGEHGKGFSVVADEIKDLAERTSFSTQEIADLIQAVRAEVKGAVTAIAEGLRTVEEGSKLSIGAKEVLKKIIESSQKSTEMTSTIEHATSEQTKGIRFVADAMENVKDMIGQIAKAASEQSKSGSLIISATENIRDITEHLKNATMEQSQGGKQIYKAVEEVSFRIHEISNGINEQKIGSNNILNSLEKIKSLPEENRKRALSMNRSLRGLLNDAELLTTELNRFKVVGDVGAEKPDILKMGVMPLESPADMYKRFSLLESYLAKRLNKKVELKVAVDFEETVKNIGDGTTDICYMTPSTYIEAKDKYGAEVIVMALRKGKPFHHTVIVAKEGGKINSMEDIKGHSFAFGDKRSTSSCIVPMAMLKEAAIDLKDLSFYEHFGHHDDVVKAVINGEFDAGGIMESTAEKFKSQGIKFIKYSFEIPEFNICVSKKISEEEKIRIKQALLELKDDDSKGREILRAISNEYTGFIEAQDSDYDVIRGIMQKLGLL